MSKELVRPPDDAAGLTARVDELPAQPSMMQILAAALIDERVQPEKLEKLYAIKLQMERDEAEKIYNENFSLMQAELPVILKDAEIVVKGQLRSKYAKYETIAKAIRPTLTKYGFSTRANTQIEGRTVKVLVTVKHKAGHKEVTEIALPLDESEYRNVVQNYGATITFCKRYGMISALDIIIEGQDSDATFYSLITEDQRKAIENLISINQMGPESVSKFLDMPQIKAKSVADILQKDYLEAMNILMRKRRQMQERAKK